MTFHKKIYIFPHQIYILNQDNRKYHHESKHKGQTPFFRILSEANQTLLNFAVIDGDNTRVRIKIPIIQN